jgi:phospholipid-binding lipoprotein MlaA
MSITLRAFILFMLGLASLLGCSPRALQPISQGRVEAVNSWSTPSPYPAKRPTPPGPNRLEESTVKAAEDVQEPIDSGEIEETIPDPLEPINRAFFQFNDRLYFWVLKPVASGYAKVVPEGARVSVRNFFSNLTAPIRLVDCLLQGNVQGASVELSRVVVNTLLGLGGLFDPATRTLHLPKQDEDLGQTLGVYGFGPGFYIDWPFLGPSSLRDTVGSVGDGFVEPANYLITSLPENVGIRFYEQVNRASLSLGEYEDLKRAALDPYIALRTAYYQYRQHKIAQRWHPAATGEPAKVSPRSKLFE